ncbi:hypothetical protein QGN29_03300 [Temperatibacter marinus]|uniref:Uncharacterized protein n=1 Tax=Temperatibacter marinus TaxID=1456591 RepID=A0AA52HB47_9PROT|nr:hypothetical protein [Temperatibacter marinus]WND03395.1 hypothetical protein QGN29_03300 [Temperatibacter marinus]
MKAFLWGFSGITALVLLHLWPTQEDVWLVHFPETSSQSVNIASLLTMEGTIINAQTAHRYLFKPSRLDNWLDLYKLGAVLVINAEGASGCSSPRSENEFVNSLNY